MVSAQDPAIGRSQRGRIRFYSRRLAGREDKARRVPELVGKIARSLELFLGQPHVVAGSGAGHQCVAQGIRAKPVDHLQRVANIPLRLRHLLPMLIAQQAVEVNDLEGRFTGKLQAEHDHARDPEEDDVVAGLQNGCWIEVAKILSILRPAQGAERPQPRAEPRIEDIRILAELLVSARWTAGRRFDTGDGLAAAVAVPDRDAVPPPELTRDGPIANVLHPVEVDAGKALQNKANASIPHRLDRRFGQRLDLHEPLLGDHGLDNIVAPTAVADTVNVVLDADEQSLLLELLNHGLARFETIQAREWPTFGVDRAVRVEDVHGGQ